MSIEFNYVKRSPSKKRKMMLWIEETVIDRIENAKPNEITSQEAIRQLLVYALDEIEEDKRLNNIL
jgi:hypothetical protein